MNAYRLNNLRRISVTVELHTGDSFSVISSQALKRRGAVRRVKADWSANNVTCKMLYQAALCLFLACGRVPPHLCTLDSLLPPPRSALQCQQAFQRTPSRDQFERPWLGHKVGHSDQAPYICNGTVEADYRHFLNE